MFAWRRTIVLNAYFRDNFHDLQSARPFTEPTKKSHAFHYQSPTSVHGSHRVDSTAYRYSLACVAGVSLRFPEQKTRNESQSHFLAFVPFLARQSRKSCTSAFLCSETKRKRLVRRLLFNKNHLLGDQFQEHKKCSHATFLLSELLAYCIRSNPN